MALTPGTRIGVYDITAAIGEGGMGQVYRATDARLKRQVAIKVLPPSLADDADRLARFHREAELLASLNHPNIATIYGLAEGGNTTALVMELVDGDDLSQLVARGALPLADALSIAKQIAEALEAAHEQGIIHRDLKPANIKVRGDGTVKVLDFGLAKAMDPAGASAVNAANSPTLTAHATALGLIIGTAAYMSPEQARGKTVDKRADIWAFGCVLHEMLTGTALFAGDSIPETLGLVFSCEPDLTTLPAATPARVRSLIARCLVKDPRQRLRDIGEARLALDAADDTMGIVPSAPTRGIWRAVPWVAAAALALVAGWALWSRAGSGTTATLVTHFEIGYPRDVDAYVGTALPPAISPDGRTVAMTGIQDGIRHVFLRRLDRDEAAAELPGTVGAVGAVFSPDGGSVAVLFSSGLITRIDLADHQRKPVTSGADITLTITWSQAGIIFSREGALWIVSVNGGAPRLLTVLDPARHEVAHQNAAVLPGGRRVLFASQTAELGGERIESVSIDGGPRSVVVERARAPVWSPTAHLLFVRDGAVLALPMDPSTGATLGTATPIISAGAIEPINVGKLAFSVSSTGTLLFAPPDFTDARVVSVSHEGAALPLDFPPGRHLNPRISPDGRRLLVESGERIEVLEFARNTRSFLASTGVAAFCTWSADGTRVVFRQFSSPIWVAADGSGAMRSVPGVGVRDIPASPGPDPDSFFATRMGDIYLMSISGAFEPKQVIATAAFEGGPQLSPDGRWLVYQSDNSGRPEIYVGRYPTLDRPKQVSAGGGTQPRWSRNNREIYYRSGRHIASVTFDALGVEPVLGTPKPLFTDDYDFGAGTSIANYDVTADGRFIMIRRDRNGGRLHVVVNWTTELKQILASGGAR